MKHILIALIFITTLAFAQTTQPIDDIDKIYLAFNAEPFDLPDWSTYIAKFTAIKFWYITGSQVPHPEQPTMLYAQAWYNPDGAQYNPMVRVSFNGTSLSEYTDPRLGSIYYMKRLQDVAEDWSSWYAYFEATSFPEAVDFNNLSSAYNLLPEAARLDLTFPAPHKLEFADSFTIGGSIWDYDLGPALAGATSPAYGALRLYPNRNQLGAIYLDIARPYSPGTISGSVEPYSGMIDGAAGWSLGVNQGLAGFGSCNEDKFDFEGPKYILVKACSIVVKPVSINVTKPSKYTTVSSKSNKSGRI